MHQPKNELLELAEQFYQEEQEEPVILGIDPAIASIGFGVIQGDRAIDYGTIQTSADCCDDARLDEIYNDIIALCKEHEPNIVGLEEPFFAQRVVAAGRVLAAYGVIKLALRHSGIGITEESGKMKFFSASSVKATILHGGASKLAVKAEVLRIFGLLEIKGADDAGDGLAIAYAVQQGAVENKKGMPKKLRRES